MAPLAVGWLQAALRPEQVGGGRGTGGRTGAWQSERGPKHWRGGGGRGEKRELRVTGESLMGLHGGLVRVCVWGGMGAHARSAGPQVSLLTQQRRRSEVCLQLLINLPGGSKSAYTCTPRTHTHPRPAAHTPTPVPQMRTHMRACCTHTANNRKCCRAAGPAASTHPFRRQTNTSHPPTHPPTHLLKHLLIVLSPPAHLAA